MAKKVYVGAPKTEVVTSANISEWFTLSDADGISSWNGTTLSVTGVSGNERVKLTALQDMTVSFNYNMDSFCKISFTGKYICDEGDSGSYTATLAKGKYFYVSISSAISAQTSTISNITCTTSNAVAREVKKIYAGVSGVARKAKKGYVGVSGVARQFYASGTPISEMAVGDIVNLNVSGTPREFVIVNQGNPDSSKYDSTCNATWLLMKDIYENRAWDSSNNDYANSDIHAYMNGTFLNLFDTSVKSIIKQVKIPYHVGVGTSGSNATGSSGLSTKVFLLSMAEIGWTSSEYQYIGTMLEWFTNKDNKIAYYNGTASDWWTRQPATNYSNRASVQASFGNAYVMPCTDSYGMRPALILPFDTIVPDNLLITGE